MSAGVRRGIVHAMSQPYTVTGSSAAALVRHARARGVDLTDALAAVGLDEAGLGEPERRVDVEAHHHLWATAAERVGDPDFGLRFAERLDLDSFHLVGHLAATSPTLGRAFERIVAFARLLHDAGRTELEKHGSVWRFFPGCRGLPRPPPRHVAEFNAAAVVVLARRITGRPWAPLTVQLEHPAPRSVAAHLRVFGVAPRFGGETFLEFDASTAELPVVTQVPTSVGRYLESYGRSLLASLPAAPEDAREQVRRALVAGLPSGAVGIDAVARRMGTTPRTLQRRLASLGVRFADLLQDARRAAAERYLADGVLPLAEITYLLGFADQSNFHRAFRRWTGLTPAAYRAAAAPPGP